MVETNWYKIQEAVCKSGWFWETAAYITQDNLISPPLTLIHLGKLFSDDDSAKKNFEGKSYFLKCKMNILCK